MADELVRKPDDDEEDEERRSRYATGEAEPARPLPPVSFGEPDTAGAMPSIEQRRPLEGTSPYTRSVIRGLEEQQARHEAPVHGVFPKIGRVARDIGEVAGSAVAPGVMMQIPGTRLNTAAQLAGQRELLEGQLGREARTEEAAERSRIAQEQVDVERQKAGLPKLIETPGLERRWTDEQGNEHLEMPVVTPGQGAEYRELGPTMLQPRAAPGTIQPVATGPAPPAGAPAAAPPERKYTYGAPKQLTPEQQLKETFMGYWGIPEQNRTPEQQQFVNEHIGQFGKEAPITQPDMRQKNDSMNDDYARAQKSLGNDAPKPNLIQANDNYDTAEKKRTDYADKLYKAYESKKQQDDRRGLRDIQTELAKDKLDKERNDASAQSDQAYYGLYAQKNYQNRIHTWHTSGNFGKDSGLIHEQLGEHGGGGMNLGPFAGLLASTPQGAVAAVGADMLLGSVRNTLNGYLDTAKKAGISDPGYQAMTAYANAIVGRMQYELGAAGVKASALRMRDVMQKVLMTVPPPNTPPSEFDRAFNQYYKTMEQAVGRRKFGTPKDYIAPTFESVFPPEQPAAAAPAAGGKGKWNPVTGRYE